MKTEELKKWCKANGYTTGGKKEELIFKCIDGELYGRLTKCPHCRKGTTKSAAFEREITESVSRVRGYRRN